MCTVGRMQKQFTLIEGHGGDEIIFLVDDPEFKAWLCHLLTSDWVKVK